MEFIQKPMKVDGELITIDEDGRYDKGGLVRFALFMGKTNVMMARESDTEDQSKVSQELADNNTFIEETMKFGTSMRNGCRASIR